jgi:hypothetical protein
VAASINLLGVGAAVLVSDRLVAATMGAVALAAGAGGREPAAVPV